jgi:N-methylhydantoinase A
MTSGGGLTTLETARRFPVRLVESGPAAARSCRRPRARERLQGVLSFDMGGTTAKICFIDGGRPEQSRKFEVARIWRNLKGSGLPVRIPVTEMVEIGAGGGSIARLDEMKRIQVGPPARAPSPAPPATAAAARAYRHRCKVVLGRIDRPLSPAERFSWIFKKRKTILGALGSPLGLDAHWAAAGIGEIVEENMASAARVHAIERGKVAERCTMIAFGGGAPLHAARLAARLGIRRVLVPVDASVGSAVGFLRAPVAFEVVRSLQLRDDSFDFSRINSLLEKMQKEATAIVCAGALGAKLATHRSVEMRYEGQGHEISVPLPAGKLAAAQAKKLRAEYEKRYEAQFGLRIADVPVEFLTWSVNVSTALHDAKSPIVKKSRRKAAKTSRTVFDPVRGKSESVPQFARGELAPGAKLAGPALIVEPQTTTLLPRGWRCSVTRAGHLLLESRR